MPAAPTATPERSGVAARLCPSAQASEGAIILGMVGPSGRLAYVTPATRVDAAFLEAPHLGGVSPERRFRFAQPCSGGACQHWTGAACGLIGRLKGATAGRPATSERPDLRGCAIRDSCRWFAQEGAVACGLCPLVITDQREPAT